MPNRRWAIDAEHPVGRFAVELRNLHAGAVARAADSGAARKLSPAKVAEATQWRTSRSSIYAALNGTRLPSENTVCALVSAWDPDGGQDSINQWLKTRDAAEDELVKLRLRAAGRSPLSLPRQPMHSTPPTEAIRRVIRAGMILAGMRSSELARACNVSERRLHTVLNGHALPYNDLLERVIQVLELDDGARELVGDLAAQAARYHMSGR
jgi:hypothetical protein